MIHFFYNDTNEYPDKESARGISLASVMKYISVILLELERGTNRDELKFLGAYIGDDLKEVIEIDYDNIMNTINALKKYAI